MNWNCIVKKLRAAVLTVGSVSLLCSPSLATPIISGATTVDLNASSLATLVGLGFSVAPISPASLNLLSVPAMAVFPITGGDGATSITHSGGLAFSEAGITTNLQDFVVNLAGMNAGTLTGEFVSRGVITNDFPLFSLGNIGPGNYPLTVSFTLGSSLSRIYGIPNLAGVTIGTAMVNASAVPEPRDAVLMIIGLLGVVTMVSRRMVLRS